MLSDSPIAGAEVATVPILPLRSTVLFPMSVVPINVGRSRSVQLIESVLDSPKSFVGILTQMRPETDEPSFDDLYRIGTLARIVHVVRVEGGVYTVKLSGIGRFALLQGERLDPYMQALVRRIPVQSHASFERVADVGRLLHESASELVERHLSLPPAIAAILKNVRDPGALADLLTSNFPASFASVEDRQHVLEAVDVSKRVELVLQIVHRQLEMLKVKHEIADMQSAIGRSEREAILRQQVRQIRVQLGEDTEDDETEQLRERLFRAGLPPEAEKISIKQLLRLGSMHSQSAEWNLTRTYLDWLADLPWNVTSEDQIDVKHVRRVLDEDHHGLEKVKRRIVEYAAIRQLRADKKGPILLFVGPPGVGKTSLGRSIARAMGRRYGRIALGGVADEAEVRGHRRTYVGAQPGRIIQALKRAGTRNPVLVLDEVDKLGRDLRGDPAAALLEVLDPEQNSVFVDHYLDTPFDLSQVTFLATANSLDTIPEPLRDRMETIEVLGYTPHEKLHIAQGFLVPKQLQEHGLTVEQVDFQPDGLACMIEKYTREAGVRELERQIASVCRHAAVTLADGKALDSQVDQHRVEAILGPRKYEPELPEHQVAPGVATGLAWTPRGGMLLFVEVSQMPGRGAVVLTGKLGNIMKESAAAAVSFVRSKAKQLELDPHWLETTDLHLHVPQGAMSKDGASLGVPMFAAIVSLLHRTPVRPDVAMTGELSLRGNILPVRGIKEKLLAAHRAGLRVVLIPHRNQRDLEGVPKEVLRELDVRLIQRMDEVLGHVLQPVPQQSCAEGGHAGA